MRESLARYNNKIKQIPSPIIQLYKKEVVAGLVAVYRIDVIVGIGWKKPTSKSVNNPLIATNPATTDFLY